MKIPKFGFFGLVLGGLLLLGTEARAVQVVYSASGVFSGGNNTLPAGPVFAANGITITHVPNLTNNYDIPLGGSSFADFGTFVVTSPGVNTLQPVMANFTLTINQLLPQAGMVNYIGTLQGQIRIGQSGAFVQFQNPLVQGIGLVIYELISADDMVDGRVVLKPSTADPFSPGVLVPGTTTIQARISVVPEPSALVLIGMGAVAPVGLMLRRRRMAQASA